MRYLNPVRCLDVAPFTGAWIEIASTILSSSSALPSHPSRVRGLKLMPPEGRRDSEGVAPFTGAWIEIRKDLRAPGKSQVAPFTGAWIEMKR